MYEGLITADAVLAFLLSTKYIVKREAESAFMLVYS